MSERISLELDINGEPTVVTFPPHHTLLEVIREKAGLTGTKHGCELGECGACTVLVDGEPILSCLMLAVEAEGRSIETVEGVQEGNSLHPLQQAFADLGSGQCGYCTSGMILSSKALLDRNADPSGEEIRQALAGNLCRCTGYHKITEAVEWAASSLRGDPKPPDRQKIYGRKWPEDQGEQP